MPCVRQSVDEIIEQVRTVPATPAEDRLLASMLRQNALHFSGLSAGEVDKVRGYILASFERRSLPSDAFHVAKEELRTSLNPIVVAGAARALRALTSLDSECRALLIAASERLEVRDEIVSFEALDRSPGLTARTARSEIASTLVLWEEASFHCCSGPATHAPHFGAPQPISLCPGTLNRIVIEDQGEQQTKLLDFLRNRTSLIAFFYTRCMNPAKCSLTISRLAELVRQASSHPMASNLGFLAITYDPNFDVPSKLYTFGRDRRFPFDENAKLVRCIDDWNGMRRMFDLQVGYGEATVNAHARELFLVSSNLQAVWLDCEQLFEPSRVLERLSAA